MCCYAVCRTVVIPMRECVFSKELKVNVAEMEARHTKEREADPNRHPKRIQWKCYRVFILVLSIK